MREIILKNDPELKDLLDELKNYCRKDDLIMARLVYDFADKAHEGQMRKSGVPYIKHCLATAYILAKMKIDIGIIIAALLHDVPEDTHVTLEEVEKNFGHDVASLVKGVTKLGKLKYRGVERYIENLRKMFVAMAEDIRVMIIKFADRINNLATLDALPPKKRHRIALESLEIYAPIANRLGMGEFKSLLEDLSFPHIYPKEYEKVFQVRQDYLAGQQAYLDRVMQIAREEMTAAGINWSDVHGREKTLYSLYKKILSKGWDNVDKVYDIVAIRIIVGDVGDCYAALGIIHKLWRPLKGRIKDYISQPKPNGYKSLHTTVFCAEGRIVEFQIRDAEMHGEAEHGIAAHWHYDEQGAKIPARDINWAVELASIQKNILEKISDLNELKVDFFRNRIFVFTPQGDVMDLPEDATPIDFAYNIHTDVGNHCNGAKVNDQMVSLDAPLKSGDVVEIIMDKNRKGPSPDWLKTVKTHSAKSRIKSNLKHSRSSLWLQMILPKPKKK
ncbi:bifunctional (p)ppGpp synthetase/guanosine-3',5'-bis(diphosphate) 3'-pyrophosphohydrolase [Patescibacteria group bacterium]|nr:MAG: bifunctional (p)ppGpp synthetase/guanosine-3',5'-bis(diphosphate) 3'-pyrophosphohydrolase [Patescibacteria group bacterium]